MAHFHTTLHSTLSPSAAFDLLADFSSAAQWDPGVATGRRLDELPVRVGSRVELGIKMGKRVTNFTYVVRELDTPRRVVHQAETKQFRSTDVITVTPHDEGCMVSYDARLDARGLAVLAAPFIAWSFRHIGERAEKGLAAALNP